MNKLKILWCVNPFQDERSLLERGRLFLRGLSRSAFVEPVYVSSPAELQISLEFSVPFRERYRTVAAQKIGGFLKRVKGLLLKAPRIIEERGAGISDAAKALADYARRQNADALVLGTHSRSGLARFFLGSYAESLLALSRTPVILISPRSRVPRLKKILFATDFSPASKKAFGACCRFAKAVGASVILQNVIKCPSHRITTRGYILAGSRAVTPSEYMDELKEKSWSMARPFLKIAHASRVGAAFRVEASADRSSAVILKTSRTLKCGMIALAAQSSRLRAGLLGSVSREVIRGSNLPVWLLRSA
ncbi:MAG TPA: universal stress protein [bacterium]|nr:universal stress protein [bacterium]